MSLFTSRTTDFKESLCICSGAERTSANRPVYVEAAVLVRELGDAFCSFVPEQQNKTVYVLFFVPEQQWRVFYLFDVIGFLCVEQQKRAVYVLLVHFGNNANNRVQQATSACFNTLLAYAFVPEQATQETTPASSQSNKTVPGSGCWEI
jgi:hypothetical protein